MSRKRGQAWAAWARFQQLPVEYRICFVVTTLHWSRRIFEHRRGFCRIDNLLQVTRFNIVYQAAVARPFQAPTRKCAQAVRSANGIRDPLSRPTVAQNWRFASTLPILPSFGVYHIRGLISWVGIPSRPHFPCPRLSFESFGTEKQLRYCRFRNCLGK